MRKIGTAITLLLLVAVLVCWKYSGAKYVVVKRIEHDVMTMENGSQWLVYVEDLYRLKNWRAGDSVKLIESKGFYMYDYLALNLYISDVVHAKAIKDGW